MKKTPAKNKNKTEFKKIFVSIFLFILIIASVYLFVGCSTTPTIEDTSEKKAEQAARFIELQSGLIQNGISGIVQLAIYHIPEGTDKAPIINMVHVVSENIYTLVSNGNTNAEAIRAAFKVNEPYYDKLFASAGEIVAIKIQDLKKNGYGDLSVTILLAAAKGLSDGTAQ